MSPTIRSFALVVGVAFLAGSIRAAQGAEGSVPLVPGDTMTGTLLRCYDRHVAEVELLRGEVFTFSVRSARVRNETILVRVLDPQGFPSNVQANVRVVGGSITAGPFKVARSGTWRFEVSTPVAHGAVYEATSKIRRTRGASARLGGARRGAVLAVAAGSTIRVRGTNLPAIALRRPGDTHADVLAPGSAAMEALLAGGLAAPRSGTYELGLAAGGGRARIVVTPPRRADAEVVAFPDLQGEETSVASWQGAAGWVLDRTRAAPDPQGDVPPPPAQVPATSPFSASLADDVPAPGEASAAPTLGDAQVFVGPRSGVGLPAAGVPRLDDVLRDARSELSEAGRSYVYTRSSGELGDVTTRVWFSVDGRPSLAPLSFDGRVAMRWTDTGGSQHLQGSWVLTYDPERRVQMLDGNEGRSPDGVRTVTSAATGFALEAQTGAWPQGRLSLGFSDLRLGADFTRTEVYGGDAAVRVDVVRGDGSSESVVHASSQP